MRSEIVKTSFPMGADCQIDGDAGGVRFALVSAAFARKRAVPLGIAAALLAAVWTFEAHGSPETRYLPADVRARAQHKVFASELDFRGFMDARHIDRTAQSVRLAQAAPGDLVDLQKALVQEHDRAELLARELTIHRHLEMLLTLRRARAATARFRQTPEDEHSEAEEHLQQERLRLKQAAESGAAELCKVLSGDRPEQSDEAPATIELQTSLQQVRERADRLEQDLAAAKRDLASETALVAKATEQPIRAKARPETEAAELRTLLQQERQRAAQLQKDLAAARQDVERQTGLAKANEAASQAKGRAESDAAELRTSLQQERKRAVQLEADLAAARRDVETQRHSRPKQTRRRTRRSRSRR